MNTNIVKGILIFATGVGVGALVTNKLLKNNYQQLVQEEIDSIKENFKKNEEYKRKRDLVDINNEKKSLIYRKSLDKYRTYSNTNIDPAELVSPPEGDNDADEPEDEEYETEDDDDDDETEDDDDDEYSADEAISTEQINRRDHITPYVISYKEFSEEKDYYDKLTISYYNVDDTLADDQEEILDVTSIIGNEALSCFGRGSNDSEVVYVRNERLASDFEVIRTQQSYQENVFGIVKPRPRGGLLRGED